MSWLTALHALAAAVWVGGMAFALVCLRPAAGALDGPARVRLMVGALGRFFGLVWGAIAVLLATGYALPVQGGHVHLMQATGIPMMLLFGHLYFAPWRRLRRASADQDWPAAARALGQIRWIVTVNLVLGLATVAIGASGRHWG